VSLVEDTAFKIAQDIVAQAVHEEWRYISLSPFFEGEGAIRTGYEALADLTALPAEIASLKHNVFIEIRGTNLQDLCPLQHVPSLNKIRFEGIPACKNDAELANISKIPGDSVRINALRKWLEEQCGNCPPAMIEGGPEFQISDFGPIELADTTLTQSDDDDQEILQRECLRKSRELEQIVGSAANIAPHLPETVGLYSGLISKEVGDIGARSIWSIANSLEAALEVHELAIENNRHSEELPAPVATKLKDLAETHRVWFLGHPNARKVEERASKHVRNIGYAERRMAAINVVEAAEASEDVAIGATQPARHNIRISELSTPAGIAALGELEEWAWNFIAGISRKVWMLTSSPPGGFITQTIAGYYLVDFVVVNEASLGHYASTIMSHGPMWWDALHASARRLSLTVPLDRKTDRIFESVSQ
jgi:hypothetical protein